MKVLVVSSKYPPEYAGSGLRAHSTYLRLKRKFGIGFEVIASSVENNETLSYLQDGVRVLRISNKRVASGARVNYWREALPVFRELWKRRKQFDLIHVFGNVTVTGAAITFAKWTKKPILIELVNLTENILPPEPRVLQALTGRGFPKQALVVCISQRMKEIGLRHGIPEANLWCRPNPVDETRFFPKFSERHTLRRQLLPFSSGDRVVLYVAKFIPRKKQDFLIEVLAKLPPEYKLALIGPIVSDGPLEARDRTHLASIREKAEKAGLQERVFIKTEFIEKPEDYIRASDVLAFPATGEAFGTPAIEAIACGIPAVCNDIPGVFDQWVTPGLNGELACLDPDLWAKKIVESARIPEDLMQKESVKILSAASTEAIDRQYLEKIRERLE